MILPRINMNIPSQNDWHRLDHDTIRSILLFLVRMWADCVTYMWYDTCSGGCSWFGAPPILPPLRGSFLLGWAPPVVPPSSCWQIYTHIFSMFLFLEIILISAMKYMYSNDIIATQSIFDHPNFLGLWILKFPITEVWVIQGWLYHF